MTQTTNITLGLRKQPFFFCWHLPAAYVKNTSSTWLTNLRAPTGADVYPYCNRGFESGPVFLPCNFQKHWLWKLLCTSSTSSPQWSCLLSSVQMLLSGSTMLKKIPFFKKSVYWTEILPFLIFNWLMIVVQVICIAVLLVGTFDIILNNVGEPVEGSLGTITRSEWLLLTLTTSKREKIIARTTIENQKVPGSSIIP